MAITDDIVARAKGDLQRALASAEKARSALRTAEAEASDLQAFLRTLERYAAPVRVSEDSGNTTEHSKNSSGTVSKPGTRARALVDTSIEAIVNAGHPLLIGDLLDAVLAAGHTLGGADQKSNLAGYLSRDPRVHSLGRSVGWDLVRNEEAASEPGSIDAASSSNEGGSDDRTTLAAPGEFDSLLGSSARSQVP